jgi:hypothetical protein
MRRKRKNNNKYPNFSNTKREITSVLRDINGFMVFSELIEGQLFYRKTNLKDINIKPDKTGRRRFNKGKHLSILKLNIIDDNYMGELFMYCVHMENQKLLPISEFTTNKNYSHLIINKLGNSLQPFSKESKKKYVNGPSNKKRTKTQHCESSQSSRTKGLLSALAYGDLKTPSIEEIFKKFDNKCFKTGKVIDITDTKSYQIDHFMPASGYWPLNNNTATLLSKDANQSKNDKHPITFYGVEKTMELCKILNFPFEIINDERYILNDNVLFYFDTHFDKVIKKWFQICRNKVSFKRYLNKEIKRIVKLDKYNKHSELIEKLKKHERTMENN